MSVQTLNALLEKTSDWDKDERYMATNDLCSELQKDIKIDVNMERRICAAVLKQLDDQSNDVQSIAVKCLAILFKKVQEAQILEICDKLCTLILEGKAELRDVYSIGLKTLISDVPDAMGRAVAARLTPRLLGGVQLDANVDVKLSCIDILTDLLKRFGREVEVEHDRIMSTVLVQLGNEKQNVRKRATSCVGAFAVVISDGLLHRLMESLLNQIEAQRKGRDVQTLIQTIGTISRTVGYRLGKHLDRVVPLFLRFCGDPSNESQQTEEHDELRENCFSAFESVVLRCPREVTSHLESIIKVSLDFMKYDPNYTYGDSEGEDDMADGDDDEDGDYEEDYAGSDDDDTSWKVRRSAVKVLNAVITSRPELLQELYKSCSEELISRFKEREENVRLDVISCFTCLLKATLALQNRPTHNTSSLSSGLSREDSGRWALPRTPASEYHRDDMQNSESIRLLEDRVRSIVRASDKQLKGNSQKTKSEVLKMLRSLAHVLKGGLRDHMDTVIECIKRCLKDKSQDLKLEALSLLRTIFETHPPAIMHPHIPAVVPLVTQCVKDDWYKIIAEALRVVGVVIVIIRPIDNESNMFKEDFDSEKYVKVLFEAVYPRLDAHDIDQEIKECAITAVGMLVRHLGDYLTTDLPRVLSLLMDKLRNEITRMPTLKALASIATSPLRVNLGSILENAVSELSQFLRQQSRPLKLTTLETLVALVNSSAAQQMTPALFELVIREASNLISDADLQLAHLALQLIICVVRASPESAELVARHSLPNAWKLAGSPLLQGVALRSLLGLLGELVTSGDRGTSKGLDFQTLVKSLQDIALQQQAGPVSKQVIHNLAICMARLSADSTESNREAFTARLVNDMQSGHDLTRHLALLCVGELGAQKDLSGIPNLQPIILQSFESGNEEAKTAAAYALGRVTAGNMNIYLPVILDYLSNPEKPQYLLLSALKEVIVTHSSHGMDFAAHVDRVLPHLFRHAENPEEGVRNMVAECLGTLSNLDPAKVFAALQQLDTGAGPTRHANQWTLATALKYSMSAKGFKGPLAAQYLQEHPQLLTNTIRNALDINTDAEQVTIDDLDVQRSVLLMINAAAHHQPITIIPMLAELVVPLLHKSMELKLQRKVNLGPFTHVVDDGLPLRKAAFSCVDTMIDTMPQSLEISHFIPYLAMGLADKDDVQMLVHQILVKICRYSPGAILGSLDQLLEPLDKEATKKLKDTQVGTEVERANDLVRSALRALVAISKIEGVNQNPKWGTSVERITSQEHLRTIWNSIVAERALEAY